MSTPTIKIYNQQAQIDVLVKSFQGPTGPQGKGLTDAQIQAAIDATDNANAAREAIQGDLNQVKDTKADAIMDTSARAASHELHAQDGRMSVTLYGKTTETGTGDKSPDNPYTISGIGYARFTNKNLYDPGWTSQTVNGVTITVQDDGSINTSGTATARILLYLNKAKLTPGTYVIDSNAATKTFFAIVVDGTTYTSNNGWPNRTFTVTENGEYTVYFVIESDKDASGLNLHVDIHLSGVERGYVKHHFYGEAPLLPDGAPLHGNGTVDDTVENDVLSGCDAEITFNGAEGWKLAAAGWFYADFPDINVVSNTSAEVFSSEMYSNLMVQANPIATGFNVFNWWGSGGVNRFGCRANAATIDEFKALLAANPLTVYYRSTEYTPDKDLRVCKTVRRWKTEILTGNESFESSSLVGDNGFYFFRTNNEPGIIDGTAETIVCNMLDESTHFVSAEGVMNRICNSSTTNTPRFILSHELIGTTKANTAAECKAAAVAWIKAMYEAGTPITYSYQLATEKNYATDLIEARKPDTLATDTVTVAGSGETEVQYPHDTKHYTDQQHDSLAKAVESNAEAVNLLSEEISNLTGEYELIEEFVVDGTVTFVSRSKKPDGTKYSFDKMLVVVSYPIVDSDSSTGTFGMTFRSGTKRVYAAYSSSFNLKASDKYNLVVTALVEIENGVVQGRNNVSLSNALEHASRNNGPIAEYIGAEKITGIEYLTANLIAAGTIIKIYGVRA